jgi:hypothetical protein
VHKRRSLLGIPSMEGLDGILRSGKFVRDIGALFLVRASVAQLDSNKAVAFVESSGSIVLLECVEPNRCRRSYYCQRQQGGPNALAYMKWMNVQLVDPCDFVFG